VIAWIDQMGKRKHGSMDQAGSAERQGGAPRETLKSGFSIRLTASKVSSKEQLDQWISGSDECPELVDILKQKFHGGRVSLEKGKENGVLHFQCAVICKEKRQRCGAVRGHLEENFEGLMWPLLDYCEPNFNDWAALQYCAKADTHVAGPWEWGIEPKVNRDLTEADLPPMEGDYQWQQTICDRYSGEPEVLTSVVHWYVDPEGQRGKTTLLKRMCLSHDFYLLDGGPQKMKFQMAKNPKKGYCINLVRSKEEHFSYEGLENMSDQLFCDTFGSDQRGMVIRKGCFIVVMANWAPEFGKLTEGRIKTFNWCEKTKDFI
jgi:hypothetical protein